MVAVGSDDVPLSEQAAAVTLSAAATSSAIPRRTAGYRNPGAEVSSVPRRFLAFIHSPTVVAKWAGL